MTVTTETQSETRRLVITWAILVGVTVTTTWGLSKDAVSVHAALAGTFALVALKIALVMWEFMELRRVALPVRYLFLGWAVVVSGLIVVVAW